MSTEASEVKQEPKKLTKKEKEVQDRQKKFLDELNRKASAVNNMLCNKFFDFFLSHQDPDGAEVMDKIKSVSAQWKVFCKRNNLTHDALLRVENYCNFIVHQYRAEKEGKTEIPKADGKSEPTENHPSVDAAGTGENNKTEGAPNGDAVV